MESISTCVPTQSGPQWETKPLRLLDYARNVYSQNGEDGILLKMLEVLPSGDHWCVEVGAWDGKHLSNTCHLVEEHGYTSVMIEPDREKFADLLRHHGNNRNVIALQRFVGATCDDNLDHLLSDTPTPKSFDLLSIDIEGNDYHVWAAVNAYAPKIVCIAYNPTIPTEVDFAQPPDPSLCQGSGLLALTKLGRRKGYELACANHNSAFFVRAEYFPRFDITNNDPRVLREDTSAITYLFAAYDGTMFVSGKENLPHHSRIRYEKRLRQLPRIFRKYPPRFGRLTRFLYRFYSRGARALGRG
jgi:hypothetical protein